MLIAPLDWGLGHATRCIPIIEKLLSAGFKVIIAAEGDQKILLQKAFPALEMLHLKGYNLEYSSTKWRTIFKIIFQVPKILIAINNEKKWLANQIRYKHLDIIISDNRFGLYNRSITAVFITHQLYIKTSLGKLADYIIQQLNYYFINRFDRCWIPDTNGINDLAGELSHPQLKPRTPVTYIGLISAIKKQRIQTTNKLLILLSGPEPQRSILEKILLLQLASCNQPAILVRGLPAATETIASSALVTIYNYLGGEKLEELINAAEIIISRSGYSTIMDILPLNKKCILIPTPGQGEQEYLANYLAEKQYVCTANQENFSLMLMIKKAEDLEPANFRAESENGLLDAINALMVTAAKK